MSPPPTLWMFLRRLRWSLYFFCITPGGVAAPVSVSEQKIPKIILILKRGPCLLLQLTQQITHQIKNNSIESVLPAYSNIWQVLNKGNHWSDQTYTKKLKMRNKPVVNAGDCHIRLLDLSSLLQIRKRSFWKYSYFKKEHLLHSSFVLNSYTGGK